MKKQVLILFLLFNIYSLFAQSQTVSGIVVDIFDRPLENAYLYNENSSSHAHSLENGSFILEKSVVGDTIRVGLLGFKTKYIVLKEEVFNDETLTISLDSKNILLDELVITNSINTFNTLIKIDLETSPVKSSQEILQKVPGLIIGQHAGGGKAEQIFLRGFDVDHGTDVALSVDGMPVNMVSHAHGQGYSDFHFVIPETIEEINFGKGPHYANKGDFNTAGFVDFKTKDFIENSTVSLEYGQFNTLRTLGLFNLLGKSVNDNAYMAIEYIATDGAFESPQNFNRINLLGKYTTYIKGNDKLSLTASHFTSRWDASGQIPQRAVNSGLITRFGAIDDTEGGNTSRTNLNVQYESFFENNAKLKTNVFYSNYEFELYSNFTFFLEDPENGDQIKQKEQRDIFGLNIDYKKSSAFNTPNIDLNSGFGLRHDRVNNNELSHTLNRSEVLNFIQLGDIQQTNAFAYYDLEFNYRDFKIIPGVRLDYFNFLYTDDLATNYSVKSETKTQLSPKLKAFYNQSNKIQWFLKTGIGFHSNDARVVVAQEGKDILPKAYGVDFGFIWKPFTKLVFNTTAWYLFLEQEFVYVGDAGIVEPSGKSERLGLDFGLRYQFTDWLYFDTDATLTKARSVNAPKEENYIPLAPDFTITGGLAVNNLDDFSGSIRYRYVDDRPANEDNSIVAKGYFVTDLNLNYSIDNIVLGIIVENLFDTEWNETQFATESRLQNEIQPVEEIHFTPGTPFFIKGSVKVKF